MNRKMKGLKLTRSSILSSVYLPSVRPYIMVRGETSVHFARTALVAFAKMVGMLQLVLYTKVKERKIEIAHKFWRQKHT